MTQPGFEVLPILPLSELVALDKRWRAGPLPFLLLGPHVLAELPSVFPPLKLNYIDPHQGACRSGGFSNSPPPESHQTGVSGELPGAKKTMWPTRYSLVLPRLGLTRESWLTKTSLPLPRTSAPGKERSPAPHSPSPGSCPRDRPLVQVGEGWCSVLMRFRHPSGGFLTPKLSKGIASGRDKAPWMLQQGSLIPTDTGIWGSVQTVKDQMAPENDSLGMTSSTSQGTSLPEERTPPQPGPGLFLGLHSCLSPHLRKKALILHVGH